MGPSHRTNLYNIFRGIDTMAIISTDTTAFTASDAPKDLFELFKLVSQSDVTIELQLDNQVDPPELRVIVSDTLGQEFFALSNPADAPLTMVDICEIFDRLGYNTDIKYIS